MTVYVDPLMKHGWVMYGRAITNCHLFTNLVELDELHALAQAIGMKRSWFQDKSIPHYDLTEKRRDAAIAAGAVPVDRHEAVRLWRERRAAVRAHFPSIGPFAGECARGCIQTRPCLGVCVMYDAGEAELTPGYFTRRTP